MSKKRFGIHADVIVSWVRSGTVISLGWSNGKNDIGCSNGNVTFGWGRANGGLTVRAFVGTFKADGGNCVDKATPYVCSRVIDIVWLSWDGGILSFSPAPVDYDIFVGMSRAGLALPLDSTPKAPRSSADSSSARLSTVDRGPISCRRYFSIQLEANPAKGPELKSSVQGAFVHCFFAG